MEEKKNENKQGRFGVYKGYVEHARKAEAEQQKQPKKSPKPHTMDR